MNPTLMNLIKQLSELDDRMHRAHHDILVADTLHDEHHDKYDHALSALRVHLKSGRELVAKVERQRDDTVLAARFCTNPDSLTDSDKDAILKIANIEREPGKELILINLDDILSGKISIKDALDKIK